MQRSPNQERFGETFKELREPAPEMAGPQIVLGMNPNTNQNNNTYHFNYKAQMEMMTQRKNQKSGVHPH